MRVVLASIVVASVVVATIFFASTLSDEELAHLRKAIDRSSRRAAQNLRASPDAVAFLRDTHATDASSLLATSPELLGSDPVDAEDAWLAGALEDAAAVAAAAAEDAARFAARAPA